MTPQEFQLIERLVRAIENNTKALEAHAAATNKLLADALAKFSSPVSDMARGNDL